MAISRIESLSSVSRRFVVTCSLALFLSALSALKSLMIQTALVPHELLLWCYVLPGVPVADNKRNLSVIQAWKNFRLCGDSGYINLTVLFPL